MNSASACSLAGPRALVTAGSYCIGTSFFVHGGMTLYPGFREGG